MLELEASKHASEMRGAWRTLSGSVGTGPPASVNDTAAFSTEPAWYHPPAQGKKGAPPEPPAASEVAEAVRQLARECVRRDVLRQAELVAHREAELAARIRAESEFMRHDHERRLRTKREQEAAAVEHKRQLEQANAEAAQSFAGEKQACQELVDAARRRRVAKLVADRTARRAAKERKAEMAKEERQRADADRERDAATCAAAKEAAKARARADADAEHARRLEVVWREAEGLAGRAEADLYKTVTRRSLVLESQALTRAGSRSVPTAIELEEQQRLERRAQACRERAEHARLAYQEKAGIRQPPADE